MIDLKSKNFWGELTIEYKGDLDKTLRDFYIKYQKILREIFGFPKDMNKCLSMLKKKSIKDNNFFLLVYLRKLESEIKNPQISKIKKINISPSSLPSYQRLIAIRLNSIRDSNEQKKYEKPNGYDLPYYDKDSKKAYFVIKKGIGKAVKSGRNKSLYNKYKEYLITLQEKDEEWILRNSFITTKEKKVIGSIFNSKRIFSCREGSLSDIFKDIMKKSQVLGISGIYKKENGVIKYSFNSEEEVISKSIENELQFLFNDDSSIDSIEKIKFILNGEKISFKIIPHQFNVRHLKLISRGMFLYKIWEISKLLKKELKIDSDIYITKKEDKIFRKFFILNSNKIDEIDINILKNDIRELEDENLISIITNNSYKCCPNNQCLQNEVGTILDLSLDKCPDCKDKLIKIGSTGIIKLRRKYVKKYIIKIFKENGLTYKEELVKKYKRRYIKLWKFQYKNKQEVLSYFFDDKIKTSELKKYFSTKNYPIFILLEKEGVLKNHLIKSSDLQIESFSKIYLKNETDGNINLNDFLENINLDLRTKLLKQYRDSISILKSFVSSEFDLNLLEGKTPQKKGNYFELLSNKAMKMFSKSWIELGQIHQDKSFPDGFGYFLSSNKSLSVGFDAKLKTTEKGRGLISTERRSQVKYIKDFRKKARSYGGLKKWIIFIKSEKDYEKFQKSINKLREESSFKKINLMGTEAIISISNIFEKSLKQDNINPELFNEFVVELLFQNNNITKQEVEKLFEKYKNKFIELKIN